MATEARPVPRPRRTIGTTDSPKTAAVQVELQRTEDGVNGNASLQYQNVTISRKHVDPESASSSATSSIASSGPSSVSDEEEDSLNNNQKVDLRNPYSDILMQIDQIKLNDQQNEKKEEANAKDKPKPAPRSRTKQQHTPCQYENHEIRKPPSSATTAMEVNNNPEVVISSATGAIKKQPARQAPPRPPSPVFRNKSPQDVKKQRPTEQTTPVGSEKMTRSSSTNTLDSSQDGSEASGSKFKTSSPGQILKSIGASSRLLTESITERMATKTKGARKKILKTSKETLFTLSSETTSTLKSVRNKINTRITGKGSSKDDLPDDLDRPMTLPPESDTAFSGIQFNSPLGAKSKASYDLTDSTYEVPKRRFSELPSGAESDLSLNCPSYEEALRSNSTLNESFSPLPNEFSRNSEVTQSMMSSVSERTKPVVDKKQPLPIPRRKSETNLSSPEIEIPCPNFPPPILTLSPVYGKINKAKVTISSDEEDEVHEQPSTIPPPPIRHRTKKAQRKAQKEEEELRACSHRATVDPEEYQRRENRIYPRLDTRKLLPEKETSKCDSWSFYDTVSKDEILSPIKTVQVVQEEVATPGENYENVEPVYGSVFSEEREKRRAENILLEFDPLMESGGGSPAMDMLMEAGKSNHLLLLETLLSQETYGVVQEDNGATSDDDSLNVTLDEVEGEENAPLPPNRQESLPLNNEEGAEEEGAAGGGSTSKSNRRSKSKKDKEHEELNKRPVMIIHQNSNLRSDSMENMIDEAELDRYLTRSAPPIEQPAPEPEVPRSPLPDSPHGSFFYVDKNRPKSDVKPEERSSSPSKQKKVQTVPSEPPPSYQEVLKEKAEQDAPSTSHKSSAQEPSNTAQAPAHKKSSMISKFFHRGIIRRSSLKNSNKTEVKTVLEMVPRPTPPLETSDYEGHLVRYPTGVVEDILKEIQFRHTTIKNRSFYTFLNSEHKNPKESFPIDDITTVQSIINQKMTNGHTDIHCFEVTVEKTSANHQSMVASNPNLVLTASNTGNSKATRVCHVYGCVKQSERSVWMQKLLENMTGVFPKTATQDYQRAGWCYMKNSISANWSGAWLLLQRRKLLFHYAGKLDVLDLRKARCIVLKEADESINNLRVEAGPTLMIDCPPFTLYLIMNWPRETKIWRNIIREEAHNNGMSLKNQQLTKDNVPVLVDKCVNFIYTHGSMSEGIYRKSGSENSIVKLLTSFREDAFGVQLTRTEYSEHDVASAMKRFMRDLPEPLLGKYTVGFLAVSALTNVKDKFQSYVELLQRLATIEYQTLRKLLGHLNFIQSQKSKNKMGTENLAMLWGPTLFSDKLSDPMKYSTAEATVMGDLIGYYKQLFHPTQEELEKEAIMLTVLQKYHAAAENLSDAVKKSGDLKVWIHVDLDVVGDGAGDENLQVSVTLTPTKTVHDVLKEVRNKISCEPYQCTLYEVILEERLERPLHYTERLLDTVLRWTYWAADADRKSNCLVIKTNKFIGEVERALKNMTTVNPLDELRFADVKTKSVKATWLELKNGSVNVLKKEKNGEIKTVKGIVLKEAIFFLGCEKKRETQCRWGITIVDKSFQKRTREAPFIGHLITGDDFNTQTLWYSCILYALHGNDLMPMPEILE